MLTAFPLQDQTSLWQIACNERKLAKAHSSNEGGCEDEAKRRQIALDRSNAEIDAQWAAAVSSLEERWVPKLT